MAGVSQTISTWSASAPEPDRVSPSMRTMRPRARRLAVVRPALGQAGADIDRPRCGVCEPRGDRPAAAPVPRASSG